MFDADDELEAKGESDRRAMLAAMEEHRLGPVAIGKGIAELAVNGDPEIRAQMLRLAVDLRGAMPNRAQKHKVKSEQRILSMRFDGQKVLGVDPSVLRLMSPDKRQLVLDAQKAIEQVNPEQEQSNGGT